MRSNTFVRMGGIGLMLLFVASAATADEASINKIEAPIYKIEEDWEMHIQHPDPEICSPQVTFFTSPSTDSEDDYFQLQMNYHADEWFDGGGFHVAAVCDGDTIDEARSGTNAPLVFASDKIRWTNVMAAIDGQLLFAVKDGHGNQWGNFGGPDYLVRIDSEHFSDLSDYDPAQSLESVDVGFGANRVAEITLKEVRIYRTDGTTQAIEVNLHP